MDLGIGNSVPSMRPDAVVSKTTKSQILVLKSLQLGKEFRQKFQQVLC